jgi:hypothetical protein
MSPMNTRLIAAAEAVMLAAVMLAAGCGSAAASAPMPTPSPTHSVMSPAASSASPSPSHSAPPPTAPTLSATTFPVAALLVSCYPTTGNGNCYQPGQYCPSSYYGATGVAEDGTTIICQDNNGGRWVRVYGTTPGASPFPSAAPATGGGGTAGFQDALLLGFGVAALLAGAGSLAYRRRLTRKR